jgi:hypothetical protein
MVDSPPADFVFDPDDPRVRARSIPDLRVAARAGSGLPLGQGPRLPDQPPRRCRTAPARPPVQHQPARLDLATARDHVRVARKLAEFPAIDDALRSGEVSYSKVRAMVRVATPDNEVLLLEHAKLMTASQLEKTCRKYALVQRGEQDRRPQGDELRRYVRRRDTEDGMVKIEAVLHPEAELVWAMLDHAAAQLVQPSSSSGDPAESDATPRSPVALTAPAVQCRPDAAAAVVGDDVDRPITSRIDDSAESIEGANPAPRSDVGLVAPLPAFTAPDRRPATAAAVVGDDVDRPITSCTNRIFLEGHHIQHWADGGETSLRNTTLLCSLHHRHVHEHGYAIELGPDQRPRFRDPHGRRVAAVPQRPHPADLGWPHIRAENEALQIDADTIAGPWDGTPVDYGRIVGHLATADGLA